VLSFHRIVRRGSSEKNLHQEQRKHEPEEFRRRPHRWRDTHERERITGGKCSRPFISVSDGMMPTEQRDTRDEKQNAEGRPEKRAGRRTIASERLARPVVRIGDLCVRPFRHGGPGSPPEKRGERVTIARVWHRVVLHRVRVAQRLSGRIIAEERLDMRRHYGDGGRAVCIQRHRVGRRVVRILTQARLEPAAQRCLLLRIEGSVALGAVFLAGPAVEDRGGFPMQPVGTPVRRDVGAVAPDRPELHAAE
jgi:hypothetical protein